MSDKELKPFDLEAALKGEPVVLRSGTKAFIRHHETELNMLHPLLGVLCVDEPCEYSWTLEGLYNAACQTEGDIIGMWPKTHSINGFEVPAPETYAPDVGSKYFVASCLFKKFFDAHIWRDYEFDKLWLERGLVFLTKEDAIANAKAMLGIDPNSPSMA